MTLHIFPSQTADGDDPVDVLYVRIQAAEFALAVGAALALRGYSSRFYHFKEVKLSCGAGLGPGNHVTF